MGSYKVLNRVLRGCASYLTDLESAIAGKQKSDKIEWNDHLISCFHLTQSALTNAKSITLPTPSDLLIIVHDGSQVGIRSVMYLIRNGTMKLGGFFSAKLKSHQTRWLPCEIEALSISASIRHFAPYIRQSHHRTQILTDSRPCVQAWTKMTRGEFSLSSRVATFITTLSDFNIALQYIAGAYNLPSDFHSRNPVTCDSSSCQICQFVSDNTSSAVHSITIDNFFNGEQKMLYTNHSTWKSLQMECHDLRRAQLSNTGYPSKYQKYEID